MLIKSDKPHAIMLIQATDEFGHHVRYAVSPHRTRRVYKEQNRFFTRNQLTFWFYGRFASFRFR
jgi:hypothetical protein